ncbi:NAD(P)-dependent dehydrogenase (short-subunit alcohol dehydrogenase family) [Paenibacillus phyllosphaerae]|uniref:NAD(P)-dependent dehydrogenase (Short-subunit alcohol dehydrogenase family) n=1 Tax=Paenibacillus phyllosphaerae TaxID=274593 RepID=A0A7W5AXV3_9BACL|nr:SDR family oxidoreductase [Paenibacillus phyllosphaerae]MBB3110753.1 NAD(P)-dependent dehydrogenase (short-subunit alcohol dehydrogenase family) [Paenibacillus phyllosphaerae]
MSNSYNNYKPSPYPVYPYYSKETKMTEQPIAFPPQHQPQQPGMEYLMQPLPIVENPSYLGSHKLKHKVAIISGGDSGIGRATAIAFAKEGAAVVIVYLDEHKDAEATKKRIEQLGGRCLLICADLRLKANNQAVVDATIKTFGQLDIVVNNLGVQYPQESLLDITEEQLVHTYQTNIFSFFFMTQAALPHLKSGSSIINTASITAYQGEKTLIDYSSTKGAIVSFTRSLALNLVDKGIRVNAVAPGPIWTPLIPASFSAERVATFGTDTPMKRAGQPFELAPTYVYLASSDSGYVTGETLHVNGGDFITS